VREAAAERTLVAADDICTFRRHFHFVQSIAQTPPFFLSDLPDESVIVIFDCAQDGAIRSNKCGLILSDT